MDGEKTTFIKIDKFDTVMSALSAIKKKIAEAKTTLEKINSLKHEEDAVVQKWEADLNAVQAKMDNIETELNTEG